MTGSDPQLAHEILDQIDEAASRINEYVAPIMIAADFSASSENQMRLDAIGMMLIAIGENLKKLDRHIDPSELERFPDVDWRGAKGIRDFLSHAYFQLQAEVVFNTCREDIPKLQRAVRVLKAEFASGPAS